MAYLDLAERFSPAIRLSLDATAQTAPDAVQAQFAHREWAVIKLAREDRLSSLREEHEFVEFLRLIFGFKRTSPLSNPRLEALRRMAVLSWHHGYNVNSRDLGEFFAAGFSIDQYDAMLGHIGRERATSLRRPRR